MIIRGRTISEEEVKIRTINLVSVKIMIKMIMKSIIK